MPSSLRSLAVARYGATGWRQKLAKEMGVGRVTVWRWEKNGAPKAVLIALQFQPKKKRHARRTA